MKCLRIFPDTIPRISLSLPSSFSLNIALGSDIVTVASTSIGSLLATRVFPLVRTNDPLLRWIVSDPSEAVQYQKHPPTVQAGGCCQKSERERLSNPPIDRLTAGPALSDASEFDTPDVRFDPFRGKFPSFNPVPRKIPTGGSDDESRPFPVISGSRPH